MDFIAKFNEWQGQEKKMAISIHCITTRRFTGLRVTSRRFEAPSSGSRRRTTTPDSRGLRGPWSDGQVRPRGPAAGWPSRTGRACATVANGTTWRERRRATRRRTRCPMPRRRRSPRGGGRPGKEPRVRPMTLLGRPRRRHGLRPLANRPTATRHLK